MIRLKKLAGLLKEDSNAVPPSVQNQMHSASDAIFRNYTLLRDSAQKLIGIEPADLWETLMGGPFENLKLDTFGYDSEDELFEYMNKAGSVTKVEFIVSTDKNEEIEVLMTLHTKNRNMIYIKFGDETFEFE
jgi:hypothetical protein